MAAEQPPRARENDDGSVDVWLGGRRLHFPGGGRKPTVTDGEEPPDDAGDVPHDVLLDLGDPVTTVSRDGWYVRLSASEVVINPTRARRGSGRLYRVFRRGG